MTWAEYYDKFYDWSESTQVNKLSSVEALGPADEVAEVLMEFAVTLLSLEPVKRMMPIVEVVIELPEIAFPTVELYMPYAVALVIWLPVTAL